MNLKKLNQKSGFTLLEVIIVLIILGVLAALAIPRFFATVEFSRSKEAIDVISGIRQSMERCYVANSSTYVGCDATTLDFDPTDTSGTVHFTYAVGNQAATTYTITATRNGTDGGNAGDLVILDFDSTATPPITRSGTGAFAGIH